MEIDFDAINDEILSQETFNLSVPEKVLANSINLAPFLAIADTFEIVDRESAKQCLSMSLQARKMRQALDKSRSEILRPHIDFQRSINKFAKTFETKLSEIERNLSNKLTDYIKENKTSSYIDLMNQTIKVDDGQVSQKMAWGYEVENVNEVPREYLCVDEKKIQSALKSGVRVIPGLKIEEKLEISMRVKN